MGRSRVSLAAFVAVPLLVGAVLLMHGLDAGAHTPSGTVIHGADGHHHHSDTGGCADCPTPHHLLAACVAVAATISSVRLACRARTRLTTRVRHLFPSAAHAGRSLVDLARPPDPAWVRLSVMRC